MLLCGFLCLLLVLICILLICRSVRSFAARLRSQDFFNGDTFSRTYREFRSEIEYLEKNGFIDSATRAVFVDAMFYNQALGLYSMVRLVFECYETGGVTTMAQVSTFRCILFAEYPAPFSFLRLISESFKFMFFLGLICTQIPSTISSLLWKSSLLYLFLFFCTRKFRSS
jgi:hypothetical protein